MAQELVSRDRIEEEAKEAVAETLGCDVDEVDMDKSLIEDLEAQSLDFLDINFRLEQTFGVKMARHFVLEHVEEQFGEGKAIDENSEITEAAVKLLKRRMGEDYPVAAGMLIDDLPQLVTARTFAGGVEDILASLPEQCGCGTRDWGTEDGTHIVCGSCGAAAELKTGDDLIVEWVRETNEKERIF